jgi:phage terminase large subunit-like protein
MNLIAKLRTAHEKQCAFVKSRAKRKVIRAGRRGGKTTGAAILSVESFLAGRRVLYATPTQEQVDRFWQECKRALEEPIEAGVFYKNETRHIIELPKSEQRIRAKTAWNADTLRGDYADLLILDEYQLMSEDAWGLVGAPMLLDNDGDAVFIYTTKRGRHHSKELFKKAQADTTGRWQTFVFSSHDNPYLSQAALDEITGDMTNLAYRAEILAEEVEDDPRALWNRSIIDRVTSHPDLVRVVVGVDPPGSEDGAECGIVVVGGSTVDNEWHAYVLSDRSLQGSPARWGGEVVTAYHHDRADRVLGEANFGGDMVENTIKTVEGGESVAYKAVHASRGKAVRAEPVVAWYERGRVHHVGELPGLEDEMCNWVPGESKYSPNRIDALVWAVTELMEPQGILFRVLDI